MNVYTKLIFIILLMGLNACFQIEETPDKLMLGYYKLSDKEGVELLNDSILVMHLKYDEITLYDTLNYKYSPPLKDKHYVWLVIFILRLKSIKTLNYINIVKNIIVVEHI